MTSSEIFLLDMETGDKVRLSPETTKIEWYSNDINPADISHSYRFECSIDKQFESDLKAILEGNTAIKTANRLSDRLNDLIEEYHVPGTPRRERRAIKREFDKIFRIFRKHCQECKIDFKFVRPEN